MMIHALVLIPLLAGLGLASSSPLVGQFEERTARLLLGAIALTALALALGAALWAASRLPVSELAWGGGLALSMSVDAVVRPAAILVPAVASPVVLWAAAHEDADGLPRLIGGLVAFAGAMELLVTAADLLVLLVAWELVGGLSFLLIAHRHRDEEAVASASYAFNATRLGGLGLFVAAGTALAATGSFSFEGLSHVAKSSYGDLFAGGILLAAASKSAQLPFAPWLMRAMAGPSSASALLHSSTMVAAGAWLLIRLHEPLDRVPWFGAAAVGIGLSTAIVGGISAIAQDHAKRLLAASTSAQYGLMFAAAGAGAAGAALAHLVAHAVLKALLFLVAGTAITAAGTASLDRMRLGRRLPFVAAASAVGALSLAAVPPLGAAWSKEMVVAATGRMGAPLAVLTIAAGGLSAFYAARFQLLVFARDEPGRAGHRAAGRPEQVACAVLALGCLALCALWLPSAHEAAARWAALTLPEGAAWELPVSLGAVLLGLGAARLALRSGKLRGGVQGGGVRARVADWMGLPLLVDALLVKPALALATAVARFDDRVVDAGVRGSAWLGRAVSDVARKLVERGVDASVHAFVRGSLRTADASRLFDDEAVDAGVDAIGRGVGVGGRGARRLQTGAVPFYYSLALVGLAGVALLLWLGRGLR